MPKTCDHCGLEIEEDWREQQLGDHTVHQGCAENFVDVRPKMEVTQYTCDDCYRSFHEESGLERHTCYDADGRMHE